MYQETPYYFNASSGKLFGVLHRPQGPGNGFGYVICTPIVEEKLWTHRVIVNFARLLSSTGFTVLRFDYHGHGDSEGDHHDCSFDTMKKDIHSSLTELRRTEGVKETGLLGLRMGASLAAVAAEEDEDLKKLILWEPILNGAKYMKELFRINITTQTAVYGEVRMNSNKLIERLEKGESVNIEGYEIMLPFYEQLKATDLLESEKTFQGQVLIVQINKKEGQGSLKADPLGDLYVNCSTSAVVEQPFWKEIRAYYPLASNLYETTQQWLNRK